MPRKRQPPRLYLRRRSGRASIWVIRDGSGEVSTGCTERECEEAEKRLSRFIAQKYEPPKSGGDPSALLITEALTVYVRERAPHLARPDMVAYSTPKLSKYWASKTIADINGAACRDYARWRGKEAAARRDLETLRAAIRFYHKEYGLTAIPSITLPPKPQGRIRWLTRSEAARLLIAAHRNEQTKHVARFILIGIYSGSRSMAILQLQWLPSSDAGWIDLEAGVLHRRGWSETETKKRRPPVRIHDRLIPHLKRWREHDLAHGIANVVHWQGSGIQKLRRSWTSARECAGLDTDVTPHILRHTCATWLMQAGVDKWEAAGFLGMTMRTLESTYGHHHPAFQRGAASAIAPKTIISGAISGASNQSK